MSQNVEGSLTFQDRAKAYILNQFKIIAENKWK